MNACLIGLNITNLILAILLSKKGFQIDLILEEKSNHIKNNRTIGISKKNIEFLKSILKIPNKYLWPTYQIEILNLKNNPSKKVKFKDNKNENFFLITNNDLLNISEKKCKEIKNIYFKKYQPKDILKIEKNNNYNFVINSQLNNILIKKFFSNNIKKDYDSIAYTLILTHKKINNHTAIQIFTKYGPLALLPLSKDKTSVVYSVQKKFRLNLSQVKDEILKHSKKYDIKKISELEKFNLKYSFPRKFVHKNILCFGDALHKIHPLAGQGFNMTLRDLKLFSNIIDNKLSYGLEIDQSALLEFKDKTKHLNYIFGAGINFINDFFKLDNRLDGVLSDHFFTLFEKNDFLKHSSITVANKGLNFVTE